jgi:hypothetical protein
MTLVGNVPYELARSFPCITAMESDYVNLQSILKETSWLRRNTLEEKPPITDEAVYRPIDAFRSKFRNAFTAEMVRCAKEMLGMINLPIERSCFIAVLHVSDCPFVIRTIHFARIDYDSNFQTISRLFDEIVSYTKRRSAVMVVSYDLVSEGVAAKCFVPRVSDESILKKTTSIYILSFIAER